MDLAGVASTKALAEQINQAGMSKGTLDRIARDGREIKAHEAEWIGEATSLPASFFLAADPVPKPGTAGESQLDRIERRLVDQAAVIARIEKILTPGPEGTFVSGDDLTAQLDRLETALAAKTDALLPGVQELLEEAQAARSEAPKQTADTSK